MESKLEMYSIETYTGFIHKMKAKPRIYVTLHGLNTTYSILLFTFAFSLFSTPFLLLFNSFSTPFQLLFNSFSTPFLLLFYSFSTPFLLLFYSFSTPFLLLFYSFSTSFLPSLVLLLTSLQQC
jgi:hypothetical protein